jgi:hypothetical protein
MSSQILHQYINMLTRFSFRQRKVQALPTHSVSFREEAPLTMSVATEYRDPSSMMILGSKLLVVGQSPAEKSA